MATSAPQLQLRRRHGRRLFALGAPLARLATRPGSAKRAAVRCLPSWRAGSERARVRLAQQLCHVWPTGPKHSLSRKNLCIHLGRSDWLMLLLLESQSWVIICAGTSSQSGPNSAE